MAIINERIEAAFYSRTDEGYMCGLCPHGCRIRFGEYGLCGSRRADDDILVAYSYGSIWLVPMLRIFTVLIPPTPP